MTPPTLRLSEMNNEPQPLSRADCIDGPRPCGWNFCRYYTPDSTCALDVAEAGGVTLEVIGAHEGISRERVRQIEASALIKLRVGLDALDSKRRKKTA